MAFWKASEGVSEGVSSPMQERQGIHAFCSVLGAELHKALGAGLWLLLEPGT